METIGIVLNVGADQTAAFEHGLIMLGCGEHTLRFCPALSITQEELDAALTLFEQTVASVA